MKVLTVVGTRPEVIRLSSTIRKLDQATDHTVVHTGQNYDYELNQIFFGELGLRPPDVVLATNTDSLGSFLGSMLAQIESVLQQVRPDAFLVLGDTNSALAAILAKRMHIPVYHMEAGNRCFDENVPEEANRRIVDHTADYNLVYTEHARRNLLAEGLHPQRILLTGSPMAEVLHENGKQIAESDVLDRLNLDAGGYFLASLHREENVDDPARLMAALQSIGELGQASGLPVLLSTHPRTRRRIDQAGAAIPTSIRLHRPFGFHDYNRLQLDSKLVLSDSGTISEESSILGFPAVTLRPSIERPECLDAGLISTIDIDSPDLLSAAALAISTVERGPRPPEYQVLNTSHRVVNFILSTASTHRRRAGIRG